MRQALDAARHTKWSRRYDRRDHSAHRPRRFSRPRRRRRRDPPARAPGRGSPSPRQRNRLRRATRRGRDLGRDRPGLRAHRAHYLLQPARPTRLGFITVQKPRRHCRQSQFAAPASRLHRCPNCLRPRAACRRGIAGAEPRKSHDRLLRLPLPITCCRCRVSRSLEQISELAGASGVQSKVACRGRQAPRRDGGRHCEQRSSLGAAITGKSRRRG